MRRYPLVSALIVSFAVFAVDLITPLGDAIWVLYAIPLLIVSSRPNRVLPLATTILSWVLIVLGYFLSPPNLGGSTWDMTNRLTGIVVQLVMALVLIHRNRIKEDLRKRGVELEKEVTERRAAERELREAQERLLATLEEERELQEQLRQSQKMEAVGTLAGGIAHDFNNVLTAIIGFSELAAEGSAEGRPVDRYIERVMTAGMRGRDLVRKILAFSRKSDQERKLMKLSDAIAESVELLRASLPVGIDLHVDTRDESALVMADPVQMQQVIMNICTNAAHAIENGHGTIAIDISDYAVRPGCADTEEKAIGLKAGDYLRVRISDTGRGMKADVMRRVFDPFFTTKKAGEGTGLGLSIAHGIVRSHGGAITVESEPGKGTRFTIYLPASDEDRMEREAGGEKTAVTGHERILFVDDEVPIAEMEGEMLRSLGYEVVSVTSSSKALALFREDPCAFDLVITDQTMPELTGTDLVKAMHDVRSDIPVVISTGFGHMLDKGSAKAAGAAALVMKPQTKDEVARTIRAALDERRRQPHR